MASRFKKMISVLAVISVAVGGFFAYEWEQQRQLLEKREALAATLVSHVKYSSLHVSNGLRYDVEKDTNITYGEYFNRLETAISEIDKRIVAIEAEKTADTTVLSGSAVAYLKETQNFLRALLNVRRKEASIDGAYSAFDEMFTRAATQRLSRSQLVRMYDALGDAFREAWILSDDKVVLSADLVAASNQFKAARDKASESIPSDALVRSEQVQTIIDSYSKVSTEDETNRMTQASSSRRDQLGLLVKKNGF